MVPWDMRTFGDSLGLDCPSRAGWSGAPPSTTTTAASPTTPSCRWRRTWRRERPALRPKPAGPPHRHGRQPRQRRRTGPWRLTGRGLYTVASCDGCHHRNGWAGVAEASPLDAWVFLLGTEDGDPDPDRGRVLQTRSNAGSGEGGVSSRSGRGGRPRAPRLRLERGRARLLLRPARPPLVGGLLEIPEDAVPSSKTRTTRTATASPVARPPRCAAPGSLRMGRDPSVRHQTAAALNGDMGVMTNLFDTPDCGSEQTGCGNDGAPSSTPPGRLRKYVSLLGIGPPIDDPDALAGEDRFGSWAARAAS